MYIILIIPHREGLNPLLLQFSKTIKSLKNTMKSSDKYSIVYSAMNKLVVAYTTQTFVIIRPWIS